MSGALQAAYQNMRSFITATPNVDYLVVAGGAGGASVSSNDVGGGGGAGGFRTA